MKKLCIVLFLLISSTAYSQSPCPGLDSLNYSGQWYHTVQIGNQCWLKENLNIGIMKPAVKHQINNDTIEKFCYNNDSNMCNIYGGLYQWREAMQYTLKQGARGICPVGWHIPFVKEYDTLISIVRGSGNALLKVGQAGGTNTSGFSGLLSGLGEYKVFGNFGINANFWTNSSFYQINSDPYNGLYMELWNDNDVISGRRYNAEFGLSIRCIKDNFDLLLQSPYGGESWQTGSSHKISWGGTLTDKKVKIEYSTDGDTNWLLIIDSTPAIDGEFDWIIPNTPSKNCKVRITDLNSGSISISDNIFSIYKSCPVGSTIEHGGKIYDIVVINNKCWFKENVNIGTMIPGKNGQIRNGILEKYCYNDDTANCTIYGGLYSFSEMNEPGFCPTFWHIPTSTEFANLVAKYIYDGNAIKAVGQGSEFGAGTNLSGFSALLAGTRSFNGTFINLGNMAWFSWEGALSLDGISSLITWTDGYNNYQAGSARCVMDDIGLISLKSPAGGEKWLIGSTQKISWTLSNVINIKIDYTTDNGTSWINIIASTPTSAGSYNWIIPNASSRNCKIRISSTDHSDTNSISNIFRIYKISTDSCPGVANVSYNGKIYNTIAIGNQCWLKENLNVGSFINANIDQSNNGIIEKYCYDNDTANCRIYGGLYQWGEAMQYSIKENSKGICPNGWHIPTWSEFITLAASVNNYDNDLIEIGQGSGTNATGFSALLSGDSFLGSFNSFGQTFYCWNSTNYDSTYAYYSVLFPDNIMQEGGPGYKIGGFSIRCLNDSSVASLPVELTSFTASVIDNNVNLIWNTATEINTSSFEIEKESLSSNSWQNIASIKASGNSTSPKQYSYIDKNVNSGKYNYRLKMIDLDGSYKYSNIINAEIAIPAKYGLSNAYPNPWNPTTTIRYQVPINILVTIKVFDALGREVSTLVNEVKPVGSYEVTFTAKGLSSGTYYYQMKAGTFIDTKKITLLK